ncbi:hypothetical protein A3A66_02435 [Microgenomates group bacterium RIFCSPLOWO2_01_FULL_46_13]|nr:MAG: hypothetical protein A2783_03315 [Microgenomates group bacterium RIFCSPHIGHO2_01_FULL_45_11]OGV94830.1 MAG: hypothetical protein A3A66_02435 [Microgenomates group bacterium RIFCSPLOWO2_01_FULL_46_13]
MYTTFMRGVLIEFFTDSSVWSVVVRGIIWFGAVLLLAYGADEGLKRHQIKHQVGMFLLFLVAMGFISYVILGVTPAF